MTDEKFVFISDVKEKKATARSSHNRKTHAGKGGRVRLPSDHMTRKELNAMNGDVKSYRLNSPMKWDEFKAMPDDLKVTYIKLLREKFGVPDIHIGKMLGVSGKTICLYLRDLKCSAGAGKNRPNWDKEGFQAWCNGEPSPDPVEEAPEPVEEVEKAVENPEGIPEAIEQPEPIARPVGAVKAVPHCGSMTFEGRVEDVLNTVSVLLGGAYCRICVSWEVCPEDGVCKDGN